MQTPPNAKANKIKSRSLPPWSERPATTETTFFYRYKDRKHKNKDSRQHPPSPSIHPSIHPPTGPIRKRDWFPALSKRKNRDEKSRDIKQKCKWPNQKQDFFSRKKHGQTARPGNATQMASRRQEKKRKWDISWRHSKSWLYRTNWERRRCRLLVHALAKGEVPAVVLLVHRAADAAGDAGDVGIEHAVVSDVHVHHAGPAHAVGGGMAEAVVWEAVVHRVRCVQLRKPVAVGRVLRHQAGRGWCHLCDGPNLPVPAPSLDALVAVLEDLGKVEHELLLFLGNRVVVDGGELLREFREGFEMELVEVALSGALVVEFIQLPERVLYLEVATLRKGFVAVVQLAYEGLDLVVRPGVGLEVTALRKRPATLVTVEGLLARMPAHMCLLSAVRQSPDGSRRERHWGHIPSSFHVGKMPARIRGFCRPTQRPVSGSPGEGEDASSHMASLQCEHVDGSRDASFGKRSWSTPRWRTCIACASGTFHQHAARGKRCDGPGTRHRCPGLVSVRLFELGG